MANLLPVLDTGYVQYIDHMGSDQRIVEAARVSYNGHSKGPDRDRKLLNYLLRNKHSSPFEMCKVTFKIKMPLFVAAQFNRHRMQNLNYQSFRYTQPDEDFYMPSEWRKQSANNKQVSEFEDDWQPDPMLDEAFANHCHKSMGLYRDMVDNGIGREMARMVLPQNLYTTCYSTWDLSNLLKFLSLRDHSHAQWEIRQYAIAMKIITRELYPWTVQAFDDYAA